MLRLMAPTFGGQSLWLACFFSAIALIYSGCSSHVAGTAPKELQPLPEKKVLKHWESLSKSRAAVHSGALTLDQAIEESLEASPELEQIHQRLAASEEQVRQAEATFYPRLVLAEDFNATDNPVYALMNIINQRRLTPDINFNDPGRQQNFATRIQGEWTLFQGGSRFYNRGASLDQRNSVGAELLAARNVLVSKVSETYYRWLQALGFIGVAEKALESADTDVQLGEARLRAEMALPSELMRLKAHRAEMHGNLITARTGARRLQAGLERLLARPIREEEIPNTSLTDWSSPQKEVDGDTTAFIKQALEKRPELAAVRSLVLAARKRIRSAQGGLLPSLGARANYEWDSEDFSGSAESWLVGIQASWVLFQGGMTLSKIREARAHLQEIESRGEQVALDIALEVHQATLALQEAAEKIQVARERMKWAQKALEEVRQLYRNQVVAVDSLLQSEVSWNQAEVSYTSALFDGKIAQALLRKSLGDFATWMEARNG
jgi:outer membrane protein